MSYLKQYYKSIIATLIILYLSLASPSEFKNVPEIHIPHVDKLVHFFMYFALTFALLFDIHFVKDKINRYSFKFLVACVLYPILLGGIIELIQEALFSPRSAEWLDWLADIAGVLVALIIMSFFRKKT